MQLPQLPALQTPISALPATAADLAYSYAFTLERLQADGSKDSTSVVVYQDQRVLASGEFELAIGSASLSGPGR